VEDLGIPSNKRTRERAIAERRRDFLFEKEIEEFTEKGREINRGERRRRLRLLHTLFNLKRKKVSI